MKDNLHSDDNLRRSEIHHDASNPEYSPPQQNEPEVNDAAEGASQGEEPVRPDVAAPGRETGSAPKTSEDAMSNDTQAALENDHGVWTPFDLPLNRARERQRARHERDERRNAAARREPEHDHQTMSESYAAQRANTGKAEDQTPPAQPALDHSTDEVFAELKTSAPFDAELQDPSSPESAPDPHSPVQLNADQEAPEAIDYEFPAAPLNDFMDDPLVREETEAEEAYAASEARAEAEEQARLEMEARAKEEAAAKLKAKARKETEEVDLLAPLRTESTGDAEPWSPESGPVDEAFEIDERLRLEAEAKEEAARARQRAEKAQRVQEKAQAKQAEGKAQPGSAPAPEPSDQERLRRRLNKYPEIRGPVQPKFHLNLNKASHRYGTVAVSLLLIAIVVLSSILVGQKQRQQANRQLEIEKDLLSFDMSSGQVPNEQTLKHSDPQRVVNATLPLFNDAQIDQWCQVWAKERIDEFEIRTNPLPFLLPEQRPILNVGHRSEIVSDGLLSIELISETYGSTKALKDGVLDQSERASFLYDLRYRVFLEPSDVFREGAYEQLAQLGNAKLAAGNYEPLSALASNAYGEYLEQKKGEGTTADQMEVTPGAEEAQGATKDQPAEEQNAGPEAQAKQKEYPRLWASTLLAEAEEGQDPDNPYSAVKLPASSILYKHLRFVPEGVEITLDPALVPQGSSNIAIIYNYDEVLEFLLFEQQTDGQFRFNYRVDPLGDTQRNYEARLLNALYGASSVDTSSQSQGLPETKVLTEEPQTENPASTDEEIAEDGNALSGNILVPKLLRAEAHIADPGPEGSPHDATPIAFPVDEAANAIPRERVAEDDGNADSAVQEAANEDMEVPEDTPETTDAPATSDSAPIEEATATQTESPTEEPTYQPQLSEELNQAAPYPPGGLSLSDHFISNKAGYSQEIRYIALTFNGSPSSQTTQRMLDLLNAYRGKGTFFVRGKTAEIETAPPLLEDIIKQGSQIGNHAYNDYAFTLLNDSDIGLEVGDTADFLEQLTGVRPSVVRPPLVSYDDRVIAAVGQPLITWSFALGDADGATVEDMKEAVDRYLEPGSIVLCTDGIDETLSFFEETLPDLYAKGYRFVTIDELFDIYTNDGLQPGKVYNSVWS